jgi:glyoxylase-like metal-dependent hydrolase (beta-lactamase superfamily II)
MIVGNYKVITIPTGRWRENCYLVRHVPTGDLMLVDPGDDSHLILKAIDDEGSQLKLIILTHAHHDHVGAVKAVCEKFQLHFYLHKDDVKLLNRAPTYALAFEKKIIEISKNYRLLGSEDLVWGGEKINLMNLPGHTQGGVCFHFGGIAFTGDTLLNEFIGRTDLPGADAAALAKSITTLLNTLPDDTLLFPGHGKPWTVATATRWWENQQESACEYREESDI